MGHYEASVGSNEWYTPKYIFDAIGIVFDLDVAAPQAGPRHVPAKAFYYENSLERPWFGLVWMNPPFGNQRNKRLWLEKFFRHGNGIALLPDRTSAPWWQEYAPMSDATLFVSPKVKFERQDGSIGEQPGTGTTLFASGSIAALALMRAKSLGFVMRPCGPK